MKYLFILGRNVKLSVEEVKSFLEREKFPFKIISLADNQLLMEINKPFGCIVDKLGGVISIGQVLAEGNSKEIITQLEKQNLYLGSKNKMNYVFFDFKGKDFEEIRSYLKEKFKEERLKATEKKITGRIKLQGGGSLAHVSSNTINEQFFMIGDCFGKIIESVDYNELKKRDMEKPVRRSELSISPRLAKILINLSQVRENETLLDPFCGIGVVLQEALLQKIKVIGVDMDKNAIDGAKQNLEWFDFKEHNYQLLNNDSTKVELRKVEGLATEPDLGVLQKKVPSSEKAKEVTNSFEKLIVRVIKNLHGRVNGRIVFTAPLIILGKKKISCNFDKISSETGLKILENFPIDEFRESSFIGRSIVVMDR